MVRQTYGMIVNIRRTTSRLPQKTKSAAHACTHSGHQHTHDSAIPYIRESFVDVPHAAMDVAAGHFDSPALGVAAGAVSVLATVRGVQNFRSGGLVHNIEGVGNLALAASSGMGAYEAFFSDHGDHHHHHGHEFGLASGLEMVHGLAEMAVGGIELKRGGRTALSLTKIAKGGAVVAAQLIPGAGPLGHLIHLGAAVAVAAMDPKH
jgi:hypothetical protein